MTRHGPGPERSPRLWPAALPPLSLCLSSWFAHTWRPSSRSRAWILPSYCRLLSASPSPRWSGGTEGRVAGGGWQGRWGRGAGRRPHLGSAAGAAAPSARAPSAAASAGGRSPGAAAPAPPPARTPAAAAPPAAAPAPRRPPAAGAAPPAASPPAEAAARLRSRCPRPGAVPTPPPQILGNHRPQPPSRGAPGSDSRVRSVTGRPHLQPQGFRGPGFRP